MMSLTSSTPVWEAASISMRSKDLPDMISVHESHTLQGSAPLRFSQLSAFAKIRAMVVLPEPRGPENKYACDTELSFKAFTNVWTTCVCPMMSENVCGRYFL